MGEKGRVERILGYNLDSKCYILDLLIKGMILVKYINFLYF